MTELTERGHHGYRYEYYLPTIYLKILFMAEMDFHIKYHKLLLNVKMSERKKEKQTTLKSGFFPLK